MDRIDYQKQNSLMFNKTQNHLGSAASNEDFDQVKDEVAGSAPAEALRGMIGSVKEGINNQRSNSGRVQYDFTDYGNNNDSDLKFL